MHLWAIAFFNWIKFKTECLHGKHDDMLCESQTNTPLLVVKPCTAQTAPAGDVSSGTLKLGVSELLGNRRASATPPQGNRAGGRIPPDTPENAELGRNGE